MHDCVGLAVSLLLSVVVMLSMCLEKLYVVVSGDSACIVSVSHDTGR